MYAHLYANVSELSCNCENFYTTENWEENWLQEKM